MFRLSKPGSVIIRIPMNPIITANHLYKPTFSLRKKIDKKVVKIGAANDILTTVARGKFLKAINIAIKAVRPDKHLRRCNKALFVK